MESELNGNFFDNFHISEHVEGRLAEPGIQIVFSNGGKSCPVGSAMKMTDTKVLFNDVPDLGDTFVSFDFNFSDFSGGGIFPHNPISDMV